MDSKRLRLFIDNVCLRYTDMNGNAVGVEVYLRRTRGWTPSDSHVVVDKALRILLDAAKRSSTGYVRPSHERYVLLYAKDFDAVVQLKCSRAIRSDAQKAAYQSLLRICADAVNEYRASHDLHTGLRNRGSFEVALADALKRPRLSSPAVSGALTGVDASVVPVSDAVLLATLDIDHFKTVNDRFGHGYGDLVLAVLARRMESALERAKQKLPPQVFAEAYRLGGEEFHVLLAGPISEGDAIEVMSDLSNSIRNDVLPTDVEFRDFQRLGFADETPLPSASERKVTISVGLASSAVMASASYDDIAKKLKRQADLSLYSAKLGGRDQVRYYGEILASHGRVTFVDSMNGVVAIDIGREIGVKNGQEFYVLPPSYDGKTSFFIGEGRSKKRAGVYPRFRSSQVVTFDVQDEISFCKVVKHERGVTSVMEGSTLEAIPLGSISHLVSDLGRNDSLMGLREFRSHIGALSNGASVLVIAVSVLDLERISDEKGINRANECLASIGESIFTHLGHRATMCQPNANAIVAVASAVDKADARSTAEALAETISNKNEGIGISVGWVFKPLNSPIDELPEIDDLGGMLDAALLASRHPSSSDSLSCPFSSSVVARALYVARTEGAFARAVADYTLFSDMGVSSAYMEGQMGFAYLYSPARDYERAEAHFKRASEFPDAPGILHGNLGGYYAMRGDFLRAFDVVKDADLPDTYLAVRIYSAMNILGAENFKNYVAEHLEDVGALDGTDQYWIGESQLIELLSRLHEIRSSF